MAERIEYDEMGMFHENAQEFGLPYDDAPVVRRREVHLDDLEDAFAADVAIDAFEAEGRRSRPLSALKAEMAR
jgi:hypothetical protein